MFGLEAEYNLIAKIARTLILAYSISAPAWRWWEREEPLEYGEKGGQGGGGGEDCRGCERTERPWICIANWRSIYGHRTANRASLELKLITFMSGAMYHYAQGGPGLDAAARMRRAMLPLRHRPASANMCIIHDKSWTRIDE